MGYSFHAVDRTGLLTMPSTGIAWDEHPNWYDLHHDYWTDYHVGGWLSTGYWLGEALQDILGRYDALDMTPMPEELGEVTAYWTSEEDDPEESEVVRAYRATPAADGRVLLFKFTGHKNFIVTPAECMVIDRVISHWYTEGMPGKADADERDALIHFGDYARFCAEHGGFSVD